MDFRNLNDFNRLINDYSTNYFPMNSEKTGMGFRRIFFMTVNWIAKLIYIIITYVGMRYTSLFITARDAGVFVMDSYEIIVLSLWMNLRRDHLHDMIKKINSILTQTEEMRLLVRATVDPMKNRLKVYCIITVMTTFLWCFVPIFVIFDEERTSYTYTDFVLATYWPGEPFTTTTFVIGILFDTYAGTHVYFNKNSIDIYVSYMVTILTAEFRHIKLEVTRILASEDIEPEEVLARLKKCVDDHNVAIDVGNMLMEQLSPNCALTYLNCIIRFCVTAFSFSVTEGQYLEKVIYVLFSIGNFTQVYFFCSCVQDLLEASSSITEDGFHENWHGRGMAVKNFFNLMGLSNRIETRVSAWGVVDLTVPSFSAILNHAYSGYLLLLGANDKTKDK